MPISRDVRVPGNMPGKLHGAKSMEPSDEAEKSKAAPNLVTVMGFGRDDVLFRSSDVGTVQWRDSHGEIVAMLIRIKPDIWGFSRRGDDDWSEVLALYGSPDK